MSKTVKRIVVQYLAGKNVLTEAAVRGVLSKKLFCFCNIHRKTPVLESIFNNVAGLNCLKACNIENIRKILRNAYFKEHLRVSAC